MSEEEENNTGSLPPDPPPPPPPPSPPRAPAAARRVLGVPLVPEAESGLRGLLRLWSVRWIIAGAVAEALLMAWPRIPADWIAPMPEPLKIGLGYFTLLTLVAAGVSRAIKQQP